MTPQKAATPAHRSRGGRGLEVDPAGTLINVENSKDLLHHQAHHLQRQYRLPPRLARVVAEIHFGRAA